MEEEDEMEEVIEPGLVHHPFEGVCIRIELQRRRTKAESVHLIPKNTHSGGDVVKDVSFGKRQIDAMESKPENPLTMTSIRIATKRHANPTGSWGTV